MAKNLLIFLFLFLMLPSLSFAKKTEEAKLQGEYGDDLTHVPFYLRFAFQKDYDIDWKKSLYADRLAFLTDYETNLAQQQAQDKAEAKAEAADEKELSSEKKEADRKAKEILKEQLAEEKAEQEEYATRQKSFDQTMTDQEKELQQMEKAATQGNN